MLHDKGLRQPGCRVSRLKACAGWKILNYTWRGMTTEGCAGLAWGALMAPHMLPFAADACCHLLGLAWHSDVRALPFPRCCAGCWSW